MIDRRRIGHEEAADHLDAMLDDGYIDDAEYERRMNDLPAETARIEAHRRAERGMGEQARALLNANAGFGRGEKVRMVWTRAEAEACNAAVTEEAVENAVCPDYGALSQAQTLANDVADALNTGRVPSRIELVLMRLKARRLAELLESEWSQDK